MKNKFYKLISFLLICVSIITYSVLLYLNILPIKIIGIFIFVMSLIVIIISYKLNSLNNLFTKLVCSFLSILLIVGQVFGVLFFGKTVNFLNKIFDSNYSSSVYSVYVLNDAKINNLNQINNEKVILYKDDCVTYSKGIQKLKDEIDYEEEYQDSIVDAVNSIINNESKAFFISEELMNIYKEYHEEDYHKLKIISSFEILTKNDYRFKNVNVSKNPFIVYLSASDTTGSITNLTRSDINLLVVINPKTGKILLINTPRDYYIELGTKKAKDKLTHAGIYGIDESVITLSNLYDIEINYYVKVNFTSFVKIINALDGIEVDSKYNFSYDGHTFKKGHNFLNGDAALAFSRGRDMFPLGDLTRGENQQAVVTALINKMSDKNSLIKYNDILSSLEDSLITNIDQKTISKFINHQIDKNIKWGIDLFNASGENGYERTYSGGDYKLAIIKPDVDQLIEGKLKIQKIVNEN